MNKLEGTGNVLGKLDLAEADTKDLAPDREPLDIGHSNSGWESNKEALAQVGTFDGGGLKG